MIILFIVFLLGTMSFSFFSLEMRLSSVHKIFVNTPKGIFESSIPIIQNVDDPKPYFDKLGLAEKLHRYYDDAFNRYTENFILSLYFFNPEDESMCTSDFCSAVKVNLEADFIFNYHYSRNLIYKIEKGRAYGY